MAIKKYTIIITDRLCDRETNELISICDPNNNQYVLVYVTPVIPSFVLVTPNITKCVIDAENKYQQNMHRIGRQLSIPTTHRFMAHKQRDINYILKQYSKKTQEIIDLRRAHKSHFSQVMHNKFFFKNIRINNY